MRRHFADREWMLRAACRNHHNPDIFFPSHVGVTGQQQAKRAAQVCADCPVIVECALYADTLHITDGVWAGVARHLPPAPEPPPPHGTEARYRWDRRHGITPCPQCRQGQTRARHATSRRSQGRTQEPVAEKHCVGCRATKPGSKFYRNAWRPDGLTTYCKPCYRQRYGR